MKNIGHDWEQIIQDEKQRNVFKRSFTEDYRPYYISKESFAGTFRGENKTIVCYLSDSRCCNCEDYYKSEDGRYLPCSHMYRLAYELEIIDRNGKVLVTPQNQLRMEEKNSLFCEVVSDIENNLTSEDQISFIKSNLFKEITKCLSGPTNIPFRVLKEDASLFVDVDLLEVCKDSNLSLIYCHGFRYPILAILDEKGFPWPDDFPKTKAGKIKDKPKWDWCLAHPDETIKYAFADNEDVYIIARPSNKLSSVWDMLLQYFERKFCDVESNEKFMRCKITHPAGAIITNHIDKVFEFPQDIITQQLHERGFNRCETKQAGVLEGRLYRQPDNKMRFCFEVKHTKRSDFEPFIEPITCLDSFYCSDNLNDVKNFLSVIDGLKKLDHIMDKAADDNVFILPFINNFIDKNIKEESLIKKDFESVKVVLDNGEIICGYRNIIASSIERIDRVIFETGM